MTGPQVVHKLVATVVVGLAALVAAGMLAAAPDG